MSRLYIANCTRQAHEFLYTLPETTAPFRQLIPAGGQVAVPRDLNPIEVEGIVQQHTRYGMLCVDEIPRNKAFSGLAYSLDKAVRAERIAELLRNNQEVLAQEGRRIREEAAVATHQNIENQIFENRMPDRLAELEMSVEEMQAPRDADSGDRPAGSAEVNEVVHVSSSVEGGKQPGQPKSHRQRRSRL